MAEGGVLCQYLCFTMNRSEVDLLPSHARACSPAKADAHFERRCGLGNVQLPALARTSRCRGCRGLACLRTGFDLGSSTGSSATACSGAATTVAPATGVIFETAWGIGVTAGTATAASTVGCGTGAAAFGALRPRPRAAAVKTMLNPSTAPTPKQIAQRCQRRRSYSQWIASLSQRLEVGSQSHTRCASHVPSERLVPGRKLSRQTSLDTDRSDLPGSNSTHRVPNCARSCPPIESWFSKGGRISSTLLGARLEGAAGSAGRDRGGTDPGTSG
jgi:hypothetical protein